MLFEAPGNVSVYAAIKGALDFLEEGFFFFVCFFRAMKGGTQSRILVGSCTRMVTRTRAR